jgi:dihydroflavonol-4-reductase
MDHRKKEEVFVTGASGFIGKQVVRNIIRKGMRPNCLVRKSCNTNGFEGVNISKGDVLDLESLRVNMRDAGHVVHLAAIAEWKKINSPHVWETTVEGTRNVLTAAKENDVQRVVYVSSSSAINGTLEPRLLDETSPFTLPRKGFLYAHAKKEAENICNEFQRKGLNIVIVNPAETYGQFDFRMNTSGNLLRLSKGRRAWITRGGTGVTHVEDVANGILAALERGHSGQRYILSSENLTYKAIAELVRENLNLPVFTTEVPRVFIRLLSVIKKHLKLPIDLTPEFMPYAMRYWFMDSQKARHQLGWRPRSGSESIRETIQWIQETLPSTLKPQLLE